MSGCCGGGVFWKPTIPGDYINAALEGGKRFRKGSKRAKSYMVYVRSFRKGGRRRRHRV